MLTQSYDNFTLNSILISMFFILKTLSAYHDYTFIQVLCRLLLYKPGDK